MKTAVVSMLVAVLGLIGTPSFAQTYSKCRTINGTVIVVSGPSCPSGTIWEGRA